MTLAGISVDLKVPTRVKIVYGTDSLTVQNCNVMWCIHSIFCMLAANSICIAKIVLVFLSHD